MHFDTRNCLGEWLIDSGGGALSSLSSRGAGGAWVQEHSSSPHIPHFCRIRCKPLIGNGGGALGSGKGRGVQISKSSSHSLHIWWEHFDTRSCLGEDWLVLNGDSALGSGSGKQPPGPPGVQQHLVVFVKTHIGLKELPPPSPCSRQTGVASSTRLR